MDIINPYERQIRAIENTHVVVLRDVHHFPIYNQDFISPHFEFVLTEKGSADGLYDMQEMPLVKNSIACIMPGHVLHPKSSSEDFQAILLVLSQKILNDLLYHSFSHDFQKFHYAPICILTDSQIEEAKVMIKIIETIAACSEEEQPHRYGMLLALVSVAQERLNVFRKEQDKEWYSNRSTAIFSQFCNLVVSDFRTSREVNYYAQKLNLSPKHFSKVIRQATNGISANEWIDQYVAAQAKRMLDSNPTMTIQELTYRLGFTEEASFCRFFKRITGITPKQYGRPI